MKKITLISSLLALSGCATTDNLHLDTNEKAGPPLPQEALSAIVKANADAGDVDRLNDIVSDLLEASKGAKSFALVRFPGFELFPVRLGHSSVAHGNSFARMGSLLSKEGLKGVLIQIVDEDGVTRTYGVDEKTSDPDEEAITALFDNPLTRAMEKGFDAYLNGPGFSNVWKGAGSDEEKLKEALAIADEDPDAPEGVSEALIEEIKNLDQE